MNGPIHPLSSISPKARLAPGVRVGPFAVIEDGVEIGPDCEIGAGAVLKTGVVMGARNRIGEHAVIGGLPQDLHFDPSVVSGVRIGDDNTIRELANIHRATKAGAETRVGNGCLLMVGAHVGHDVVVHNKVVVCNYSLLAGFVEVMDNAFISGNCALHQHIRVGRFVMVAGITKLPQDAPPFALIEGHPGRYRTINSVGLKRGGILGADRDRIKAVYRTLYLKHGSMAKALADLETQPLGPLEREIVDFVKSSRRGILSGPERHEEESTEVSA